MRKKHLSFRRNHGPNLFSRQENLLAKRLAGWGIGEECNPAVTDFSFFTILKVELILTAHHFLFSSGLQEKESSVVLLKQDVIQRKEIFKNKPETIFKL